MSGTGQKLNETQQRPLTMQMNNFVFSFTFLAASLALGQTTPPSQQPSATPVLSIGIAIPCRLIFTVDSTSAKVKTPVIAIILENVVQDGKMVVPKGTEATCVVEQPVAFRDRIAIDGKWHLMSPQGKSEGEFDGVACDREADSNNLHFGPEDGSAGLRGTITGEEHFVRVPAGKEFYIVTTGSIEKDQNVAQAESIQKAQPATLPLGFKIPCSFVCDVDGQSQTPILAVVTNDVWWNSKIILPKGTRVDALRQPAVDRDRLQFKGLWVITAGKSGYFVDAQALFEDGTVGVLAHKKGDTLEVPAGQGFYLYLVSPLQVSS